MPKAAVLGSPIAHSLSPVLHRAGYAACGLRGWRYTRHEVTADQLVGFVAALGPQWRGLSLTMPLKEAALGLASTVSAVAARAGAVNTLVRRDDGGWDGTNTDVAGIVAALSSALSCDGPARPVRAARVLGSGATARSAVLALAALGVEQVSIAARNEATSAELLELASELGMGAQPGPLRHWVDHPGQLVISTLPPAASAATAQVLRRATPQALAGVTLLDVVYAGWPTPLALSAAAAGAHVISGLDMLVHQAAAQFVLFTGVEPDVSAMFAAGRAALAREGSR